MGRSEHHTDRTLLETLLRATYRLRKNTLLNTVMNIKTVREELECVFVNISLAVLNRSLDGVFVVMHDGIALATVCFRRSLWGRSTHDA